MYLIQVVLVAFFVFAIIKVWSRKRAGDLSLRESFFWTVFWAVSAVVVLLPDSTFYFARKVGVGRGADLMVYLSLAAIFYLIFRLMVRIEKMNKEMAKLTRKITLEEIKK